MLKRLPLGIKSIEKIIDDNYLYIDKTMYYKKLIDEGIFFFLSRPRRFGKTLLISTLKEIFKGNKELFKGLDIYEKHDFEKYPIIHLDFNEINHKESLEKFNDDLTKTLFNIAKNYNVEINGTSPKALFVELYKKLSKINDVVILIDEYDKPIIDSINNKLRAEENKEFISSFYEAIKTFDKLKFVLLTGVTKVSKTSVFSKLNNLTDISMDKKYSGMLGITEKELYFNFEKYIEKSANELNISVPTLKEKLKKWYNGYSWDNVVKVYNPYSVLSFFKHSKFKNYWFETGTPTFLINLLKNNNYDLSNLETTEVDEMAFSSFDLENLQINSLLYQTGYLTIDGEYEPISGYTFYKLKVPNFEVKKSLMNAIFNSYSENAKIESLPPYLEMIKALIRSDYEIFVEKLQTSFASIPYSIYPKREDYYHSIFFLMMNLIGAKVQVEVLTDKGRIDGVLELEDKIYIIEFKTGDAKEGIEQIKTRKYYEKYRNHKKQIILLSVGGFNDKAIEYIVEKI